MRPGCDRCGAEEEGKVPWHGLLDNPRHGVWLCTGCHGAMTKTHQRKPAYRWVTPTLPGFEDIEPAPPLRKSGRGD